MSRVLLAVCSFVLAATAYLAFDTPSNADSSVGSTNYASYTADEFAGAVCRDPAAKQGTASNAQEMVFYRGKWYVRCRDCEDHGVAPDGTPLCKPTSVGSTNQQGCPTCPQARGGGGGYRSSTYTYSYSSGRVFDGRLRGRIFNGRVRAFVQKVRERFSGRGFCRTCG